MSDVPCTDIALERRTVAALIYAPREAKLAHPVIPCHLTDPRCRAIADCLVYLIATDGDTTPMGIVEAAEHMGRAKAVGGIDGVFAVMTAGGMDGDLTRCAQRVTYLAKVREHRDDALRAVAALEALDLVKGQRLLLDAAEGVRPDDEEPIQSAFEVQRHAVRELLVERNKRARVRTGFKALDRVVGFVSGGDLIIVGADTGVGKTSTLLAMAQAQSAEGRRVGFVSCEDGRVVLGSRLLSGRAGLKAHELRRGALTREQMGRIDKALEEAREQGLYLSFAIGATDVEVTQSMTQLVRAHGCESLMVDYIQTINPSERSFARREDIRRVASRIKSTAARLGVPVFLASQLTRPSADKREKGRTPTKHDLKEAGDLENMAELILLLQRESVTPGDDAYNRVRVHLAKSKVGGDGLTFTLQRHGAELREADDFVDTWRAA